MFDRYGHLLVKEEGLVGAMIGQKEDIFGSAKCNPRLNRGSELPPLNPPKKIEKSCM